MSRLPLPLPALAALAGGGGFIVARLVGGGGAAPAAPADGTAAAPDLAGGGDLWSAFGGDGTSVYGDQGGGQLFPPGDVPPPDPGSPAPAPTPAPTSTAAACWVGHARPTGAAGYVVAHSGTWHEYVPQPGGRYAIKVNTTGGFSAWVAPSKTVTLTSGSQQSVEKILNGAYAGKYCSRFGTNPVTHICPAGSK